MVTAFGTIWMTWCDYLIKHDAYQRRDMAWALFILVSTVYQRMAWRRGSRGAWLAA